MKRFSSGLIVGLIVGLLLATTTFAFADNPIKLVVKGSYVNCDPPPIMYQDRVFVPIRFVAEALNYGVGWANNAVYVGDKEEPPKITGSSEFISKTQQALNLLKTKDVNSYKFVLQYTKEIHETPLATLGPHAIAWTDSNGVCYIRNDIGYIPGDEIIYRAIIIIHESVHLMQYHTPGDIFRLLNSNDQEIDPYLVEYRTAQKIGASQELLDLIEKDIQDNLKL